MFENLTRYYDLLDATKKFDSDQREHIIYECGLTEDIYALKDGPLSGVHYDAVLADAGIPLSDDAMERYDVSDAPGQLVAALLFAAVRSDYAGGGGTLAEFAEHGTLQKWLNRLMYIDELDSFARTFEPVIE